MVFRYDRIIHGLQYRLFALKKLSCEVSFEYFRLICDVLLGRPSLLIAIGGFIGVAMGMNMPLIPGTIAAFFTSVIIGSALLLSSFVRRNKVYPESIDLHRPVDKDSNKRGNYDANVIVLFAIIFVYSFSYTAINKSRSEIFLNRAIEEGVHNQSYEGYIVDAPFSDNAEKASAYVFETNEGVKISFFSALPDLGFGDYVIITGKLTKHRGPSNPGGFDYKSYYSSDGIYLKLSASDSHIHIRPERHRSPGWIRSADQAFYILREWMKGVWREVVSEEETGILSAMILGDKSGLSDEMKDRFRSSNLSHLIAVSGLHVSCFLIPILFCFKITGKRRVRKIGIVLSLLFFGFLTGWSASVTRAVIMSVYGVIASFFDRRVDSISGLFTSSILLLLVDPYVISDIGFQLSFCATLSIILIGRRLTERIDRCLPRFLSQPIASMLSAQIGMIPILIKLSAKQSPALMLISIFGTVLSQGICTLAIPISAIYFALSSIVLDHTMFRIMFLPVRGLIFLLDRISRIGEIDFVDALRLETLSPIIVIGIFGLVLLTILKRSSLKRCLSLVTAFIMIAGICTQIHSYVNRPMATVVFLDVGQGDSALILAQGKSVLIDGGEAEMCDRVLIPTLNYYGIRKVDIILMTHLHSDHGGGLLELITEHRAENIGVPFFGEGEDYDKITQGHEVDDIFYLLSRGDRICLSDDVCLYILHPSEPTCNGGNEDSLVTMLMISGTGVLFMGDSGFSTEEELMKDVEIRSFIDHNTDIMKVGHHGSKYSTSEEFLSLTAPEAAIISVGNNFYGHPTIETISRLQEANADVFRTDNNGAVILNIYEDHTTIRTMLD